MASCCGVRVIHRLPGTNRPLGLSPVFDPTTPRGTGLRPRADLAVTGSLGLAAVPYHTVPPCSSGQIPRLLPRRFLSTTSPLLRLIPNPEPHRGEPQIKPFPRPFPFLLPFLQCHPFPPYFPARSREKTKSGEESGPTAEVS